MQHLPEPAVDTSSGHESEAVSEDEPVESVEPVASDESVASDEVLEPEADASDEAVPDEASAELDGFARDLDTVDAALEALDNDDLDAAEARVAELATDSHPAATPTDTTT